MLIQVLWMGAGLVLLVAGADAMVRGASRLALSLGISPLVVGLTIVAFGTSAPEFAVSLQAVRTGQVDVALGNVVGSNIFNVLFILGLSAVIAPLLVNSQLIRQEVPVMIVASLVLFSLAADGGVSRDDGLLLVALLGAYTVYLVVQSRRATLATQAEFEQELAPGRGRGWDRHWAVQLALVGVGLALLVLGSRWLVGAAVAMATALGVSELVIGLTIVAAGTSLPEVATSVMATIRGERDIAVGNVVGSNTFNLLGVLGLAALIAPKDIAVPTSVLLLDLPLMTAVALACLPVFLTGRTIERWEGVVFLGYYVAYTAYLVLAAQRYPGLPPLVDAMAWFVVPLILVTLVSSLASDANRPPGPPQ